MWPPDKPLGQCPACVTGPPVDEILELFWNQFGAFVLDGIGCELKSYLICSSLDQDNEPKKFVKKGKSVIIHYLSLLYLMFICIRILIILRMVMRLRLIMNINLNQLNLVI
jgi:hypothetical protein